MASVVDRPPDQGTGRKLRVKERRLYTEEFPDEEIENTRLFSVEEKLSSDRFDINFVKELNGEELTVKFFQENGFIVPILVKSLQGLGMKVPEKSFGVEEIRQCVGNRRILDVMDVTTQTDSEMTMKEWCKYWEETPRTRFLNVISLEFSHTKLENLVESPAIVRSVDWVDHVWPKHLKEMQTESTNAIEDMKYPKVQKYVLMSVVGCYTDFHIDFGGTSVWYHILKGKKVFWLIPPSEKNIQLFEQWVLSGKQADIFFGDLVDQCSRVYLEAGDTFFIPSGYIHSVFTPEDSIVFGGNFLHSYAIEKQLRVAQVEDTTRVPVKFRFPFYTEMLWYLLERYVHCLTGKTHLSCREDGSPIPDSESETKSPFDKHSASSTQLSRPKPPFVHLTSLEVTGLKAVIMWLSRLPNQKRAVPDLIVNAEALLNDAKILVDDHANDHQVQATSGKLTLYWKTKPKNAPPLTLTAQLRQMKPGLYSGLHKHNTSQSFGNHNNSPDHGEGGRKLLSDPKNSLCNFAVKPSTILNEMPSSFNDLIASSSATPVTTPTTNVASSGITSFVSSSLLPSTQSTTNLSSHNIPVGSTAKAAALPQQKTPDHQSSNRSPTPISVIPDQVVDLVPSSTVPLAVLETPQVQTVSSVFSTPTNKGSTEATGGSGKSSSSNDSSRRRRTRCKKCDSCVRADCGECHFCKDMKKFGGPGRMKQSCITRQCMTPVLPHTACCTICGRDGWEKLSASGVAGLDANQSSLMECSQCWEIVHPICLKEKYPSLSMESGKRDDLPNSWECPKCVSSTTAAKSLSPGKAKLSLNIKAVSSGGNSKELQSLSSESPGKKLKRFTFGETTSSEDEVPREDEIVLHKPPKQPLSSLGKRAKASPEKNIRESTPKTSFVKSCARFLVSPHETEFSKENPSLQMKSSAKPDVDSNVSAKRKKSGETLKDRLFRSLKTLKKNCDPLSPIPKTQVNAKSPFSMKSPHSKSSETQSNANNLSTVVPVLSESQKMISNPAFDEETDEETEEEQDETMDTNDNDIDSPVLSSLNDRKSDPEVGVHGKPLIKPKYVVRPAPIPQDCIESDDNDDDEEEEHEDDSSEDEKEKVKRRVIRKHLRRLRRPIRSNLALERDVIFPTFKYLSRQDILTCSRVCKPWNAWSTDPSLWKSMNASSKRITPAVLISIVRRQPLHLDLSWTKVSRKQLAWLLPRIPQLKSLSLSGCSASAVMALVSSTTPLLKSLDLSWIDAFDDDIMRELTREFSPADQRPGLSDLRTRLRLLQEINLAGSDITDESTRMMSVHMPNLSKIDLSNCTKLTDNAISNLMSSGKVQKMTSLQLYGCDLLTDHCFESLKKCSTLSKLDLRNCDRISIASFTRFFQLQSAKQHRLCQAQNKLMCVKK